MNIKANSPVSALFLFWTFTAVKHLRPSSITAKHSSIHSCCLTVFFSEFTLRQAATHQHKKDRNLNIIGPKFSLHKPSLWLLCAPHDLRTWICIYGSIISACKQSWCGGCMKPRGANREAFVSGVLAAQLWVNASLEVYFGAWRSAEDPPHCISPRFDATSPGEFRESQEVRKLKRQQARPKEGKWEEQQTLKMFPFDPNRLKLPL